MKHEKDVDLYDSVAKGEGLLPFFSIEREVYLGGKGNNDLGIFSTLAGKPEDFRYGVAKGSQ